MKDSKGLRCGSFQKAERSQMQPFGVVFYLNMQK